MVLELAGWVEFKLSEFGVTRMYVLPMPFLHLAK
jgi:hypothetical protein